MAPQRPGSGQLDEISTAIGEIRAYVHDWRHSIGNLAGKVDGLSVQISRDIAAMEARIEAKFDAFDKRVARLEAIQQRQDGAVGVWKWIGTNWPITAIGAALAALIAWANGKLG